MIVFCTTCKNRTQHLERTLPKNLEDNADFPCKLVVLDYNSQDHLLSYLKSNHQSDIESGRLTIYSMLPGPDGPIPFQMAHAKNIAHRCGIIEGGDILINMDADGFGGNDFAAYISNQFASNDRVFMQAMWNRWINYNDGSREWLTQEPSGEYGPPVPKGSNGRMVVTRNAFLLAGGYDEKYNTWGPDDKDFNIRLRRLGYEPRLLERRFHDVVLHNDKVRFREYPQAAVLKGNEFQIKVHDSDTTIANFGKFGKATVYRNFDFSSPIELGDVPTRIFGIGLHKTGTTSLHSALLTLGYDSAHWITAHWAKAIYTEMINDGRSRTLEKHYAICDLPIPILYDKLDIAYPGSKFILTIRNEDKWIESVRGHWSHDANQFRHQWDNDPFSHFIHKEIYGRRGFDAETFLARYRRHNAEVQAYFASRPSDLLILRNDFSWDRLCRWLGHVVPSVPYPKNNISSR